MNNKDNSSNNNKYSNNCKSNLNIYKLISFSLNLVKLWYLSFGVLFDQQGGS